MEEPQLKEKEQEVEQGEKDATDLNRVFEQWDLDLNQMFPAQEMRKFLLKVARNRRSNERFLQGARKDKLWEEDG